MTYKHWKKTILTITGFLVILAASLTTHNSSTIYREKTALYQNIYDREGENWKPENMDRLQEYSERTNDPNLMVEVTQYPNAQPTVKQLEKAWKLYNQTYEHAEEENWFEIEEGLEAGYFNWKGDKFHFPHENYTRQNGTLNPRKPEFLMYYPPTDNESEGTLAGVMFQTSNTDKHGEQVGGPITEWHYHYFNPKACLNYWGAVSNVEIIGPSGQKCPPNSQPSRKSYQMLHVWFVDHPESQFSTDMVISREVLEKGTEKLTKEEFYSKHR